jgi:hypothetical protein
MGTKGPFLRLKAQLGNDADHSPPFSAKVKNEQELYILPPSPKVPPQQVVGPLYLYFKHNFKNDSLQLATFLTCNFLLIIK